MSRPSGLGRGLSALLGDAQLGDGASASAIRDIPVAHINPNPDQPRRHFDDAALDELAESIASHGVMQPITVREYAGFYQIIAGERRWRAAQRAQLHAIPAIVRAADDGETLEFALIENIQREQLNAIEEGEAYRRLIDEFGHSAEELGKLVHKSRSHIANSMRLLELSAVVKRLVAEGRLSMGHARALLGVPDADAFAERAAREAMSVRQVERLARAAKRADRPEQQSRTAKPADADVAMLERQLADILGLKVAIAHDGTGGRVTLNYATLDQLDMICQRLSGERI